MTSDLHINELALKCKNIIDACLCRNGIYGDNSLIAMVIMAELKAQGIELVNSPPKENADG
ncbi:MAG: hypothetical protein COB09_16920 [Thalassobium sp.]|nr:MAG: hypothetical protein COB09_16920 [Thalassobium sp.]